MGEKMMRGEGKLKDILKDISSDRKAKVNKRKYYDERIYNLFFVCYY